VARGEAWWCGDVGQAAASEAEGGQGAGLAVRIPPEAEGGQGAGLAVRIPPEAEGGQGAGLAVRIPPAAAC
jgi:hypothetical protein